MGIISKIESLIVKWRNHVKLTQKGPAGNFWRNGGNDVELSVDVASAVAESRNGIADFQRLLSFDTIRFHVAKQYLQRFIG